MGGCDAPLLSKCPPWLPSTSRNNTAFPTPDCHPPPPIFRLATRDLYQGIYHQWFSDSHVVCSASTTWGVGGGGHPSNQLEAKSALNMHMCFRSTWKSKVGRSRLGDHGESTAAPTQQEMAPSSPHLNADAFPVGNKVPETQLPSFLL